MPIEHEWAAAASEEAVCWAGRESEWAVHDTTAAKVMDYCVFTLNARNGMSQLLCKCTTHNNVHLNYCIS